MGELLRAKSLVEDGRFIGDDDGKRVLEHPDGRWVKEKYIGKTGMDYAEYLIRTKCATAQ